MTLSFVQFLPSVKPVRLILNSDME